MSKEQFILKQTIGAKLRRFFFGLSNKEYKRLQNRVYKSVDQLRCDEMYVSISESGTHYIPKPEGGTIIFSQTLEETKKQLDKILERKNSINS